MKRRRDTTLGDDAAGEDVGWESEVVQRKARDWRNRAGEAVTRIGPSSGSRLLTSEWRVKAAGARAVAIGDRISISEAANCVRASASWFNSIAWRYDEL